MHSNSAEVKHLPIRYLPDPIHHPGQVRLNAKPPSHAVALRLWGSQQSKNMLWRIYTKPQQIDHYTSDFTREILFPYILTKRIHLFPTICRARVESLPNILASDKRIQRTFCRYKRNSPFLQSGPVADATVAKTTAIVICPSKNRHIRLLVKIITAFFVRNSVNVPVRCWSVPQSDSSGLELTKNNLREWDFCTIFYSNWSSDEIYNIYLV